MYSGSHCTFTVTVTLETEKAARLSIVADLDFALLVQAGLCLFEAEIMEVQPDKRDRCRVYRLKMDTVEFVLGKGFEPISSIQMERYFSVPNGGTWI